MCGLFLCFFDMHRREKMNCSNCGAELKEGVAFCGECGTSVAAAAAVEAAADEVAASVAPEAVPEAEVVAEPAPAPASAPAPAPVVKNQDVVVGKFGYKGPKKYRPITAWGFFGLDLLYSIPVIGLIFLIIFTFSKGNINRRSHARSKWCGVIIALAIIIVALIVGLIFGKLPVVWEAVVDFIASLGIIK